MINNIPIHWDYSSNMELLFMFYQCSEEMLSNESYDTYRVPVHNSLTLCQEIKTIYQFLQSNKQIDRYYKKYIPIIIDELIAAIHNDDILKKFLNKRLNSIITGLTRAKETPLELTRWINLILHSCSIEQYINSHKEKIIDTIIGNKNKLSLIRYSHNFYSSLIFLGYSMEYLHKTINQYFNNNSIQINCPTNAKKFLDKFSCHKINVELYFVADSYLLEYYSSIEPSLKDSMELTVLNEKDIFKESGNFTVLKRFYDEYHRLKYNQSRPDIKMFKSNTRSLDPYQAMNSIYDFFDVFHCFEGYFKHKYNQKGIFDVIYFDGERYRYIKQPKTLPKRPFLTQDTIEKRIMAIFKSENIARPALFSLLDAISMHSDAINCKNSESMLRTFWIALETLFFDNTKEENKENAVYSLIHIIQKTYLLKCLRIVYSLLESAVDNKIELNNIGINDFESFLFFFSKNKQDSDTFKKLTSMLSENPLLRSRIYNLRKELSSSIHIKEKLKSHYEIIFWHISRIYRTRNLSTHAGISMKYTDEILYNLHNYFDYAVNYIIFKLENKDYLNSITALVFEAKNDNQIHLEMLQDNIELNLNKDNYLDLLFGPDHRIVKYKFETV